MKYKPMKSLPVDDPVIGAAIERALEPYKKIFPPATVQRYREQMQLLLTGHPYAIALANQIRPRAPKAESDEGLIETFNAAELVDEPVRSSGKGTPR